VSEPTRPDKIANAQKNAAAILWRFFYRPPLHRSPTAGEGEEAVEVRVFRGPVEVFPVSVKKLGVWLTRHR
jgi:hypothetical protein